MDLSVIFIWIIWLVLHLTITYDWVKVYYQANKANLSKETT